MMEPAQPGEGMEESSVGMQMDQCSGNVSIERVLTALRHTEPAPGLEDRLLQRLAVPVTRSHRALSLRWAVPVILAAGILCAVTVYRQTHAASRRGSVILSRAKDLDVSASAPHESDRAFRPRVSKPAPHRNGASAPEIMKLRGKAEGPMKALKATSFRPERNGFIVSRSGETRIFIREREERARTASAAGIAPPSSYPAPELPLTEQERLLLKIAHRNDPVQIAALDPVARELELAREHAETKRFFTPPPRPPEIQHDIDEAMKSQTIITPATDRTLP